MGTESIEASFLSIFALISFFIFLLTSKYSHKFRGGALLDKDFLKPQAFHETPITRSGGLGVMISLIIFFGIYYILFSKILYDYILISLSMFLIGFLDDLFVDEHFRGQKIAQKLIKYLESLSKENNWNGIRWITHSSNETAKKLYDKIAKNTGFELYELKRD